MKSFVVSDIHGHYSELWSLLDKVGLVDDNEQRTDLGCETQIIQIGDLLNAVLEDITGDELCASRAQDWFDFVLLGNHESPYVWGNHSFGGYHEHPPLMSLYNSWVREGFVRPAHVIGDTLISHAGWAWWPYSNAEEHEHKEAWEPKTAQEAYDRIIAAWESYPNTDDRVVFDMVSRRRGGWTPIGGILWSDWSEAKVSNFNQVVGHTPNRQHPQLLEYENGKWSLVIDSGCKGGGSPTGVWLDEEGNIIEWVTLNEKENDGIIHEG